MTPLSKPIFRRCSLPHRGRRIVVGLEPGDVITLRPERTRQEECVPIAAVYDLAVKMRVAAERAEKARKKKFHG
jgi:hypothetical protein